MSLSIISRHCYLIGFCVLRDYEYCLVSALFVGVNKALALKLGPFLANVNKPLLTAQKNAISKMTGKTLLGMICNNENLVTVQEVIS